MKLHLPILILSSLVAKGKGQIISFNSNVPDDIVTIMPPEQDESDTICNETNTTLDLSRTGIWNFRANNLTNLHIKCLNLEGNHMNGLHVGAMDSKYLPDLTYLNLANSLIDINQIEFLKGYENLKTLVLDGNENLDLQFYPSVTLPNLENLHLCKCNLKGNFDLNSVVMNFPRLEKLYLSDNDITTFTVPMFANSALKHIHLERNYRLDLNHVLQIKSITHLFLDGELEFKSVALHKFPSNLQVLSLRNLSLVFLDNYNIDYKLTNLTSLDLSHNNLLSSSVNRHDLFPSLLNLSLSHNSLREIPKIIESEILQVLSLSFNQISEIGSRAFVNNLNLTILSLRGNQINHVEENSFLPLIYLRVLDLAENQLSFLPPNWARNFYNLHYLNVNCNNIQSLEALSLNNDSVLEFLHWRNNNKLYRPLNLPSRLTIFVAPIS